MQSLIGGLLQYSRVGRQEQAPEKMNLEAVLDQALSGLAQTLAETKAKVARQPMPFVMGDASLLAQVFQNLIANAELADAQGISAPRYLAWTAVGNATGSLKSSLASSR